MHEAIIDDGLLVSCDHFKIDDDRVAAATCDKSSLKNVFASSYSLMAIIAAEKILTVTHQSPVPGHCCVSESVAHLHNISNSK